MPYRPAIRPVRHRRSWFPRPPTPLRESGSALMSDTRTRDLSGSFGGGLVDMRLRAGLRGDLSELAPDLFHPALCPPAGAPHRNAARSRTGSGAGRDRRVRRARRLLCLRRRRREDQRPLPAQPAGLPAPARPPPDVASRVRPSAIAHRRRRSSSSAIRGSSRASPGAAASERLATASSAGSTRRATCSPERPRPRPAATRAFASSTCGRRSTVAASARPRRG